MVVLKGQMCLTSGNEINKIFYYFFLYVNIYLNKIYFTKHEKSLMVCAAHLSPIDLVMLVNLTSLFLEEVCSKKFHLVRPKSLGDI